MLNAAEFRGVNVGTEYIGGDFHYMGVRIEDTPQTQIGRFDSERCVAAAAQLPSSIGLMI